MVRDGLKIDHELHAMNHVWIQFTKKSSSPHIERRILRMGHGAEERKGLPDCFGLGNVLRRR